MNKLQKIKILEISAKLEKAQYELLLTQNKQSEINLIIESHIQTINQVMGELLELY